MDKFKPLEFHNVVDKEYQDAIYKYLTDINFDWHFMEDATAELANTIQTSTPAFGNLIYYSSHENNPHAEFFKPLVDAILEQANLKLVKMLRIRAGFLLNTKYAIPSMPYKHNTPHQDYNLDHYVACYYVNDTDGDTIVFNETTESEKYYPMHKCTPQKGKALLFNGLHYHASSCPKMFTKRLVITINFRADKNG